MLHVIFQNYAWTWTDLVARKFFQNATEVADILQLPTFVVEDLGTIWTTLCSGEPIDSDKFGRFCQDFVVKFKNVWYINWYQWSPTLHKGQVNLFLHNFGQFL